MKRLALAITASLLLAGCSVGSSGKQNALDDCISSIKNEIRFEEKGITKYAYSYQEMDASHVEADYVFFINFAFWLPDSKVTFGGEWFCTVEDGLADCLLMRNWGY